MSAIVGLFLLDGRSADRLIVVRMASKVAHRGPDGASCWSEGPVGFGARLLQTTTLPESADQLIARAPDDAVVVVADARVDNRAELAVALDLHPSTAETIADAELILAAYQAWGSKAPKRIIGDFAFAIWDNARKILFCARDPIGVRPFFYHRSDRLFVFASEIKALLCVPEVPRELDEIQVAHYLDTYAEEPERTFYRGIQRLPAAHTLEVSSAGCRMERYWGPDAHREIHYPSSDQYAAAFREVFLEAVRTRIRNVDPVGAALSGGLDSSSIVTAARLLLPKERPLHAFSAVFPGLPDHEKQWTDESAYIDAVAGIEGIVSHRVPVDRVAPLVDYDRALWHLDSPRLGFNRHLNWALFGAAQRVGVRVYLDGMFGDTVVNMGYGRMTDLGDEERWSTLIEEVIALTERTESSPGWFPKHLVYPHLTRLARTGRWGSWLRASREIAAGFGRSRRNLFLRYGIGAFIPAGWWERWRGGKAEQEEPLIRQEFARRIGLAERRRELLSNGVGQHMSGREAHARALASPNYQSVMELVVGAAAAFGIEPRFPFLDRRLVEFCIAIPMEQKLAAGWTRLILRQGMDGILPPAVQWRVHKGNLAFGFIRGMREVEGPKLHAILFGEPSVLEDFVDMDVLRSTYERFLASEPSLAANKDAMLLYRTTLLARWLRHHGPGVSR